MTNEELQKMVEQISLDSFHRPFLHRAIFNPRLRTTGGRYLLITHGLEFNNRQLQHFGIESFVKIIKHELCHYHLHLLGMGYRHRDADFRMLLAKVGGSRYCEAIPHARTRSSVRYDYQCAVCGAHFKRKRKLDTKRYVCGTCGGSIRLISKRRIN
ncbi:SprT family protein [Sporolactobacillus terrae]|uniref:Protein SprT-like n=1 Tax=Sporolactobacillus terrae TaxID=269673 RepID=A0A410DBT6_9BACL|nr:SprT family protein [Sporolactobacillus terrae]QAA23556.1 SprT family protein [Sporolactobacillus terrae]QAA26526.1 SprT family protein [Sporolactobacillus terrae]UAK15601.1 SprT family protein [Sporolactobacillus terrae]BBO00060.1 protein SprT [Sporolactobacillus terrae]